MTRDRSTVRTTHTGATAMVRFYALLAVVVPLRAVAQEGIDLSKPETWGETIARANMNHELIFDQLAQYALSEPLTGYHADEREKAVQLLARVNFQWAIQFYIEHLDLFIDFGSWNAERLARASACQCALAVHFWNAVGDIVHHLAYHDLSDDEVDHFVSVLWDTEEDEQPIEGIEAAFVGDGTRFRLPLHLLNSNDISDLRFAILNRWGELYPSESTYNSNLRKILAYKQQFSVPVKPPSEAAASEPGRTPPAPSVGDAADDRDWPLLLAAFGAGVLLSGAVCWILVRRRD